MKVCSDDYVVINQYANGDPAWIETVDTDEKRKQLIQFSFEISWVFIQMSRHFGDKRITKEGEH